MPFKSKAQRRKFAELLVKGEISPETFEEWNRETGSKELPERAKPKPRKRKPSKPKKRSRRAVTKVKRATGKAKRGAKRSVKKSPPGL
jgi:hypothetical protein